MQRYFYLVLFAISCIPVFAQQFKPPHLEKEGKVTQLIVKNKPFLVLGGELHNSSVSTASYMRSIWQKMKQKNLNTVLAPVYWEQLEPKEGVFDFSLVDSMIYGARKQNLHLGLLWFGLWKTTYSTYAPIWVKTDTIKYPRAKDKNGKAIATLSTFSSAALNADTKAFKMLMTHIREVDENFQTVIMMQVENEIGLFNTPRDYCENANRAYSADVPQDLINYLVANKTKLQPEIDSAWKANGYKTSGNWESVFGNSATKESNTHFPYLPEELFTVYNNTKFVGQMAKAGKDAYPIPMFVNAWPKAKIFGYPGKYPSGGPIPYTLDFWRMNAPAIEIITPNIYAPKKGAISLIEDYSRSDNPILLPEFRNDEEAANFAFYVYGKYNAICFSPFGIDDLLPNEDPITKTYEALSQVQNLILQQGKGTMMGIFVDTAEKTQTFTLNGFSIKASLIVPRNIFDTKKPSEAPVRGAGILFATSSNEFIAVGKDYELTFTPLDSNNQKSQIDVDYMEEGNFIEDKWVIKRRLNGDEGTGGGDIGGFGMKNTHLGYLRFQKNESNNYSIIKIKFYNY